MAFGHIPGQDLWIFYNFAFDGGEVAVVPGNQIRMLNAQMEPFVAGARVLEYRPPETRNRAWQPIATCVSEVAALIGTNSRALRAARLMADLLAENAKIIQWEPDAGPERATGGVGEARPDPRN